MADPTAIATQKYVSLTTYKKDGTPKSLPVWIVGLPDGRVGFTTESDSWKVKRIANDPRVVLQPSNARGAVEQGSAEVTGTARFVTGGEFEEVLDRVKAKYGVMYHVMMFVARVRGLFGSAHAADSAIVITLDDPATDGDADTGSVSEPDSGSDPGGD